MELTLWKKLWSERLQIWNEPIHICVLLSQYSLKNALHSKGSVELCGFWSSLPLALGPSLGLWSLKKIIHLHGPWLDLLTGPDRLIHHQCFLFFYLVTKMEIMVKLDTKLTKYYTRIPPVWVPVGLCRAHFRWLFTFRQIWHSQSSICF